MLKIVLIRHGYSMGNKLHTLSGWHDVALTEEGIEALLALQKSYPYPKTDGYYSSDLSRAYDTAQILFPDQSIAKLADFREIHFGLMEGWSFDRIDHDQFFSDWLQGAELEEGESYLQFRDRVFKGLEKLSEKMIDSGQESASLVCHSGVIRTLVTLCCKKPLENLFEVPVMNGLGYELLVDWVEGKLELKAVEKLQTPEMMGAFASVE